MNEHLALACADFDAPSAVVVLDLGYLGIDPGKEGWIAYLDSTATRILEHHPMPLMADGTIDFARLGAIILSFKGRVRLAVVERPITIPDQDPATSLVSGIGFGAIVATLVLSDMPREIVDPSTWKAEMGIQVPHAKKGERAAPPTLAKGLRRGELRQRVTTLKRRMKEGYTPTDDEKALIAHAEATSDRSAERKKRAKELSERKAAELFPGYDFRASSRCKVTHDGKCESALLGVVGARRYGRRCA